MIPNELIIIGGGASIQEGIALNLKGRIKNKFVIALNFAYRHFDHTLLCFVDKRFYVGTLLSTKSPDTADIVNYEHLNSLKKESLIVGTNISEDIRLDNTIVIKNSTSFETDILNKGCYRSILCGLFGLTLGSWIMNFTGTIYLLGYDWTTQNNTHYYADIQHRGLNWTSYYAKHSADAVFSPYKRLLDCKIWNVSINSNISVFNKLDYNTFLQRLDNRIYNQSELRHEIKEKLCTK